MRLLTDQLNGHIQKMAQTKGVPVHWWPSMGGGTDGAKSKFVQEHYAKALHRERGSSLLKISSYLPFECEFYFNGHNAVQVQSIFFKFDKGTYSTRSKLRPPSTTPNRLGSKNLLSICRPIFGRVSDPTTGFSIAALMSIDLLKSLADH
jgi:hypothetical protein